jgi:thiol-disulfide isomerase/thioredoxin
VSSSTLSTVAGNSLSSLGVTATSSISGTSLTYQGKPEVLYIGAEFCPYCAAERWSMIVALSKFGTFNGLEYMQSSSSDIDANTATFTFLNATYSSQYISFVSREYEDRSEAPLQTVNSSEQALWSEYDPSSSSCAPGECIPFIDFGNQYAVVGAQYSPTTLSNLNWTQIASQLNNPNSAVAKAIDGAANTLITAICKIDGGSPSSVCSQSFANVAYTTQNSQSSWQQFLVLPREEQRSVPNRLYLGF